MTPWRLLSSHTFHLTTSCVRTCCLCVTQTPPRIRVTLQKLKPISIRWARTSGQWASGPEVKYAIPVHAKKTWLSSVKSSDWWWVTKRAWLSWMVTMTTANVYLVLSAQLFTKCFTGIISFTVHKNSMKSVLLFSFLYIPTVSHQETVTCPWSHGSRLSQ